MSVAAIISAVDNGIGMKSKKNKAMQEVLFKPMLDWVTDCVKKSGIEKICVISDSHDIIEHLDGSVFVCDNLVCASEFLCENKNDDVVFLFGDTPFVDSETITSALSYHRENNNEVTFISSDDSGEAGAFCFKTEALLSVVNNNEGIFKIVDRLSGSVYVTDNENAFLSAYTKKQMSELNEIARAEVLENLMDCGVDIPCRDGVIIGSDCKIGADTLILPGTIIRGEVTVGENCVIGPNSYVENAQIGNNVRFNNGQIRSAKILNDANIGPFVQIRPDSVVGNGVHLGNFVEVKNSVIDDSTAVSHLTYVGDSDVGKNVNFGCGVVTVNFNGKTKHRTVIKDRAFIGCNTNLVAPVTVGENSYTAAGSTITEDVPDNTLALARERQTNKEGWVKRKQPYRKKV